MPLMMIKTSVPVPAEKREALLAAASRLLAEATGKPESYIMVTLDEAACCFGGKPGPAAFADVRGIGGLTKEVNCNISEKLCALLESELDISPDMVYATFLDVPASSWSWKGETFG